MIPAVCRKRLLSVMCGVSPDISLKHTYLHCRGPTSHYSDVARSCHRSVMQLMTLPRITVWGMGLFSLWFQRKDTRGLITCTCPSWGYSPSCRSWNHTMERKVKERASVSTSVLRSGLVAVRDWWGTGEGRDKAQALWWACWRGYPPTKARPRDSCTVHTFQC